MKPLFTIHGGEYLFGNAVEKQFPHLKTWIPSKDVGVDFLITDSKFQKPLAIQVKYSKDFNWSHGNELLKPHTKSAGWYSLKRHKIEKSNADYWVLVNYDGFLRSTDYLFVKPQDLLRKFDALGRHGEAIESYVLVTRNSKCYETRNLLKREIPELLSNKLDDTNRDFTSCLSRWDIIKEHFN